MSKARIKNIIQIDYTETKDSMTIEFEDGTCYKRKMTTFTNEVSSGRRCSISDVKLDKGERIAKVSVSAKNKPSYWFSLKAIDTHMQINKVLTENRFYVQNLKKDFPETVSNNKVRPTLKQQAENAHNEVRIPTTKPVLKKSVLSATPKPPVVEDIIITEPSATVQLLKALSKVEQYVADAQESVIKAIRLNGVELRKLNKKKEVYGKLMSRAYNLVTDIESLDD